MLWNVGCTERLQREKDETERRHLEEMSEDEYDALTDEQKAAVDQHRLEIKKQRIHRSAPSSLCYAFLKTFYLKELIDTVG